MTAHSKENIEDNKITANKNYYPGYSEEMLKLLSLNKNNQNDVKYKNSQLKTIADDGKNILSLACYLGLEEIAIHIYDRKSYKYLIFEIDKNGNTAFTYLCKNNMKKLYNIVTKNDVVNIIEYVPLKIFNNNNETLMIMLCKNKQSMFALDLLKKDNKKEKIKLNLNIHHQDNMGYTALMYAIENNLLNVAIKIISKMNDVNQINKKNETALMIASKLNCEKVIKELLKRKNININHKDDKLKTALIYAACKQHYEAVNLLTSHIDCNAMIKDNEGKDALMYSLPMLNEMLIMKIVEKMEDFNYVYPNGKTILNVMIYFKLDKLIDYIITSKKYDFEFVDSTNKTLLIHLVENKMEKQAMFLLNSKEEINCEHEDNLKNTALYYATYKNIISVAEKILNRRDGNVASMNIDGRDFLGNLLLHMHEDLVLKTLKQYGSVLKNRFEDVYCVAIHIKMKKIIKYLSGKVEYNKIQSFLNDLNKSAYVKA